MASKKTSQEVSGAPIQSDDLHRIARGGSNYKLTSEQIFSEQLTFTDLTNLINSNGLITGRYYVITDALGNSADRVITKAISNNEVEQINFKFNSSFQPPLGDALGGNNDLTVNPYYATDMYGNLYISPYGGSTLPDYNNGTFQGNVYDGTYGSLTLTNWNTAIEIFNNNFSNGNYDLANSQYRDCTFNLSNIINQYLVSVSTDSCKFSGSTIYITEYGDEQIVIGKSNFENSTIGLNPDNGAINIENCTFKNCIVNVLNNANIQGLTIIGTRDENGNLPTYVIDGAYQNRVFDNWGGTVISGINGNGSSTVRGKLTGCSDCSEQGTYDDSNEQINLIDNSPVGIYEFQEYNTASNATINMATVFNSNAQLNHSIKLKWGNNQNNNLNTITFNYLDFINDAYSINNIIVYHGKTSKVGELKSTQNYLEMFAGIETQAWGDYLWFMKYGTHYDL